MLSNARDWRSVGDHEGARGVLAVELSPGAERSALTIELQ